jgi:uncharacterized protein (DUF4415 family)
MTEEPKRYRGQRGAGKRPALGGHVTIRLSSEAMDFYRSFPSFTAKMREVLTDYADTHR